MDQDRQALKAAAFLAQALAVEIDLAALAAELKLIEQDGTSAVYTAQFDSSVGTAAFLLYVYSLNTTPGDHSSEQAFASALETLQTTAERDAPGPRIVAHARTAEDAFILATTPATARALAGEPPIAEPAPAPAGISATNTAETRREAAAELLRLLRAADAQATTWLAAIQAKGRHEPGATDLLAFDDVETELALYLLDERSIQNLLRALNLFLTAARESASAATAPAPDQNGST